MFPANHFFNQRRAGLLLHPTSLPGTPGNGDLGEHAYYFIDFLADSGLSVWQMLPLGPPHSDLSPYQCQSVHATNPLLINLDRLVGQGWLAEDPNPPQDLETAIPYRLARLKAARSGFAHQASQTDRDAYSEFIARHAHWLEEYALFRALKTEHQEAAWWQWPPPYRDRDPQALAEARLRLAAVIEQNRFEQFIFFSQWHDLKHYAHVQGVYLFGDMPIFVAEDSVDVWVGRENFLLDEQGRPLVVAGVPPDYFSATGQRWGNPHYNWD
ncbi:MAG: 4-alpha-glucanotransferase, partial [Pseudomonadota bacterium]|nr:4-alpha-glucanotransferase [Pseudomonadota bacterium]